MKRHVLTAIVAAVAPAAAAAHKPRAHVPGCSSRSCDDRIGARWAKRHQRALAHAATASWYGPGFYGHTTACGQTLTTLTRGVAHKTLACGTRLRLCAKRCVVTWVIDRGPYVAGREFDLTAATRADIGAAALGTVRYAVVGG